MSTKFKLNTANGAESLARKRKIWNNCEYVWTISDFHNLKNKPVGHEEFSPIFQASADETCVEWYLSLYPSGRDKESKDFISLFLNLEQTSKFPVFAEYELSSRTSKGELIERMDFEYLFTEIDERDGSYKFVERNVLEKQCIDNIIQIRAYLSYSVDELESFQKVDPDPNLLEAWNSILENTKFADVVLVAEGEEIKAHKVILSSRSPVFRAMFSHDLLENESGKVEISDISVDTIRELLRFIYTNDLNIQGTDQARSLIQAAEKYAIPDLKLLCSDYLRREITVSNAEDMLLFADTYNVLELKQCVMEYITDNPKNFPLSNQFKKKLSENPELILELLSKTMKKFAASK